MGAWEILTAGSTIPDGDAWEHLGSQGSGTSSILVLADGLGVSMETVIIEVAVDPAEIVIAIEAAEVAAEIDTSPIEV
jgi:hypothetical protein